MTNQDLIKKFVNGGTKGIASHLYIRGNELVNYSTILAIRTDDGFKVNIRKYSRSTTNIQTLLLGAICQANKKIEEYEGEPCYYWNYGYVGAETIKARDVY